MLVIILSLQITKVRKRLV